MSKPTITSDRLNDPREVISGHTLGEVHRTIDPIFEASLRKTHAAVNDMNAGVPLSPKKGDARSEMLADSFSDIQYTALVEAYLAGVKAERKRT